jgi:hypothetical protein
LLALVLLVAGAGAVINSCYGPAALGLLRAVVPADQLSAASSRMQARSAAARLVGPVAGGALFAWHPAAPFAAEAIGLLLSTTCLAFMRTRSAPAGAGGGALRTREMGAGLVFLWQRPYLRTVLLVFGLGMNAAFSATMFAALAIGSRGGHSGLGGGTIASLTAAGSLTGALLAPKLRTEVRPALLIAGTCWVCTAAAAVLVVVGQPVLIGLLSAGCMAVGSMASIGFLTTLLLVTPEELVGRRQSAAGFISSLVQPVGPLAAGALLEAAGQETTFGLLGLAFAASAAVLTWAPSVRRSTAAHTVVGPPVAVAEK